MRYPLRKVLTQPVRQSRDRATVRSASRRRLFNRSDLGSIQVGQPVLYGLLDLIGCESFPFRALRAAGKGVHLGNDLLRAPIDVVDQSGRVVRTFSPR